MADRMASVTAGAAEKGLHNPMFAPVSAVGPIACIWEVKYGVDVAVLQEFLDAVVGAGVMNNSIKKCVYVLSSVLVVAAAVCVDLGGCTCCPTSAPLFISQANTASLPAATCNEQG